MNRFSKYCFIIKIKLIKKKIYLNSIFIQEIQPVY